MDQMIHHHHHDIKIWKNILGRVNNWTYLTSELWTHTAYVTEVKFMHYATGCFETFCFKSFSINSLQVTRVFRLSMNTIQNMMGTLQGIQVKTI